MDPLQKRKVVIKEDKINNSIEMSIRNETHTLGNALCSELQRMEHVSFAAYKIPHPLQNILKIKVVVKEEMDEHPVEVVKSALQRLVGECETLLSMVAIQSRQ